MKVVHYLGSLSRSAGGLCHAVSGLAKALANLGAEVTAIGGADEYFERDRAIWGDSVHLSPHGFLLGKYGLHPKVFADIISVNPDVLHIHGIWSAASLYGRFGQLRGIPVIVSPHGMVDPWILGRRPWLKAMHAAFLERPLLARSLVHSLNVAERQAVLNYVPGAETAILPNGIDIDDGVAGTATVRSGVLYMGRLHAKKQVIELVKSWGKAHGRSLKLTIAGWGDGDYENALKELVARTPGVEFIGPLHGPDKHRALKASRFFILPSLSEGLPMAVLEAMAVGAIPVLTDQCNMTELFEEQIAIRMESDFSDIAEVLCLCQGFSEAQLASLSDSAIQRAKDFNWDRIAAEFLKIYERLKRRASI